VTYACGLAEAQQQRGDHVCVLAPGDKEDEQEYPWDTMVLLPGVSRFGYTWNYRNTLKRIDKKFKPDIVHVHATFNYLSDAAAWWFHRWRVTTILSPHGGLERSDVESTKPFAKNLYRRLISDSRDPPPIHFLSSEERDVAIFNPGRRTFCIAPGAAEPLRIEAGAREELLNAHFPRLADRPFILFLARISYHKGADLLLEAFRRFIEPHHDFSDLCLVMAGWEEEPILGDLLGPRPIWLDDRTLITGGINDEVLKAALLRSAVLVAAPSRWESFGYTVVEAGLASRPVVLGENSCMAPKWREAGAIATTATSSAEAVANGLLAVLDQSQAGQLALAETARSYFSAHYSWTACANAMSEVYKQLQPDSLTQVKSQA
jgi:glycosyltransferase involved in cell wall biosynthesis